jgi:hypothetical protein
MTQESIIVIVIGAIVVGLLVWIGLALRRSYALRKRFGPEYVRVVETVGDKRKADVSVDHPQFVAHYREAHAVAVRSDQDANTEDLRQAVIHYRALFEDLLETREPVGV